MMVTMLRRLRAHGDVEDYLAHSQEKFERLGNRKGKIATLREMYSLSKMLEKAAEKKKDLTHPELEPYLKQIDDYVQQIIEADFGYDVSIPEEDRDIFNLAYLKAIYVRLETNVEITEELAQKINNNLNNFMQYDNFLMSSLIFFAHKMIAIVNWFFFFGPRRMISRFGVLLDAAIEYYILTQIK